MHTISVNGLQLASMLSNGYRNLKNNMKTVDELNVFPVPDGDTGKNMTMTIEGGVLSTEENADIGVYMAEFSRNSLMSARGNSGVILSQFIKGFSIAAKDHSEFTVDDFKYAMEMGTRQAYDAVIKPVEGTMLTVIREASEAASGKCFDDFEDILSFLTAEMEKSLKNTPELLPVLKEAGVVDSGGAGMVFIFDGMTKALDGVVIDETVPALSRNDFSVKSNSAVLLEDIKDMEYGYCTEFILQLMESKNPISDFDLNKLIDYLESVGDSIVAVREDVLVKVHVHTYTPEKVLEFAHKYGEFISLKIENMTLQHTEITDFEKSQKPVKYAIVAVASGKGIADYFLSIGASVIVDGGQTNNPSAAAFLDAFKKVNADNIVVLPNDSNILLTAKQAAAMYTDSKVYVIETKSLAEGYSALSMMDLSVPDVQMLISDMTMPITNVTTGYVTTAIRDASLDGVTINKDKWLGLTRKTVYSCEDDPVDAALKLIHSLPDIDDKQVITMFYGKGVDASEVSAIESEINERYPMMDFGSISGEQEIYRYIFCIE